MNQDPATPRPTPARVQLEGRLVLKFDTLLSPDNPDHQAFANDLPNVILNEAENRKLWDVEGEGIEGEFAFNLKATVARNPEHPPENYGELYVDFAVTATLDEIPEDDGPLSAAYGKGWAASLLMVIGEELNANPGALLGQDRETEDGGLLFESDPYDYQGYKVVNAVTTDLPLEPPEEDSTSEPPLPTPEP